MLNLALENEYVSIHSQLDKQSFKLTLIGRRQSSSIQRGHWARSVQNCLKNPVETIIQLTEDLKSEARRLGFVLAGVTAAAEPARILAFNQWLENGYAGQMHYLEKRAEAYRHPAHVLEGCRSLLMLALPYRTAEPPPSFESTSVESGRVARYALGEMDYHEVIHERLKQLKNWLEQRVPGALVRGVVDTAPLLEREFAEAAGLGWIGKNTLLLNRTWGSYFFLAVLLTDLALDIDPPQDKGYCGTCTACLDACPTAAFVEPYVLDATRCLSYLTIEHRGPVSDSLAKHFDQWAFGCDICQEVCPWNRKAKLSEEDLFEPSPERAELRIEELLQLDDRSFRERFRHTPMWRAKRRGMLRNAILIAVGKRLVHLLPCIQKLQSDEELVIRDAANWAVIHLDETAEGLNTTAVAPPQVNCNPDSKLPLRK